MPPPLTLEGDPKSADPQHRWNYRRLWVGRTKWSSRAHMDDVILSMTGIAACTVSCDLYCKHCTYLYCACVLLALTVSYAVRSCRYTLPCSYKACLEYIENEGHILDCPQRRRGTGGRAESTLYVECGPTVCLIELCTELKKVFPSLRHTTHTGPVTALWLRGLCMLYQSSK